MIKACYSSPKMPENKNVFYTEIFLEKQSQKAAGTHFTFIEDFGK